MDKAEILVGVLELREKLVEISLHFQRQLTLKPRYVCYYRCRKAELNKMACGLGTRRGYIEGKAFGREKQEENRLWHMVERERKRDEDRVRT